MKQLRILGRPYSIIEKEAHYQDDPMMGRCNTITAQIILRKDLENFGKRQTLLHEIVHAIGDELVLDLTEKQVAAIAIGLASIKELMLEVNWK